MPLHPKQNTLKHGNGKKEANKEIKWWVTMSASEFSKLLKKKKFVYIAEQDNKIIGYLAGNIKEKQFLLGDIYIKKDYRNQGLAKKLIKSVNPDAKVYGIVKDITKAYQETDILVYPLRMQLSAITNPLVLLEAMSCGCAVITSGLTNTVEIANNAALYASTPFDIELTVNNLFLHKKVISLLGQQARKRIVKRYDKKIMIKEYLKLYKELLK